MTKVTLKEAVRRYQAEEGSPQNSYNWFRNAAARGGSIPIGSLEVEVFKEDGIWFVGVADFEGALASHRDAREKVHRNTLDHQNGIFHGADGDVVRTDWGCYGIRGQFRVEHRDLDRIRHRSYGTWICNLCNQLAETNHDKKPCHRCTDWTGCGGDCTLSGVSCRSCGHALSV